MAIDFRDASPKPVTSVQKSGSQKKMDPTGNDRKQNIIINRPEINTDIEMRQVNSDQKLVEFKSWKDLLPLS